MRTQALIYTMGLLSALLLMLLPAALIYTPAVADDLMDSKIVFYVH